MRNKIVSVVLEYKNTDAKGETAFLNETTILAVLSGISIVYEELFLWNCGSHILVMAFGRDVQLLQKAFDHHRNHFQKVYVLDEAESVLYFNDVIEGRLWNDSSLMEKFVRLNEAFDLADTMNTLGLRLYPIVTSGLIKMRSNPKIAGARNSWIKASLKDAIRQPGIVQIKSSDIFFRFSVN